MIKQSLKDTLTNEVLAVDSDKTHVRDTILNMVNGSTEQQVENVLKKHISNDGVRLTYSDVELGHAVEFNKHMIQRNQVDIAIAQDDISANRMKI